MEPPGDFLIYKPRPAETGTVLLFPLPNVMLCPHSGTWWQKLRLNQLEVPILSTEWSKHQERG